jgi:hypothetical protein
LLGAAGSLTIASSGAGAADIAGRYYTAPASNSAFSWAGPYVGATLGY